MLKTTVEVHEPSQPNYEHGTTKSARLSQKLHPELANQLVAAPRFFELLNHGAVRCYKENQEEYSENELFKVGDKVYFNIPDYEQNERNIYQVTKLVLNDEYKHVKVELVQPRPGAIFTNAMLEIIYDATKADNITYTLKSASNTTNSTLVQLIHAAYDQLLKRVQHLADDPVPTLYKLRRVTDMEYRLSDKLDFHGLNYGIRTNFIVPVSNTELEKIFNHPKFLNKIFSDVTQVQAQNSELLHQGDKCTIKFNNMQRTGLHFEAVQELIEFTIQETGKKLELLSNDGVNNFGYLGCGIYLEPCGENENNTMIKIGYYHGKSSLFTLASTLQKVTRLFTNAIPDPVDVLKMRSRSLIETVVKHVIEYINAELKLEMTETNFKPVENSLLRTNSETNSLAQSIGNLLKPRSRSNSISTSQARSRSNSISQPSHDLLAAPATRSRRSSLNPEDYATKVLEEKFTNASSPKPS